MPYQRSHFYVMLAHILSRHSILLKSELNNKYTQVLKVESAYSVIARRRTKVVEYSWDPIEEVGAEEVGFDPPFGVSTTRETPCGCCGNQTVTVSTALVRSTLATRESPSEPPSSPPEKVRPAEQESRGKCATDSSLVWQVDREVTSSNSCPWVRPNTQTGCRVG